MSSASGYAVDPSIENPSGDTVVGDKVKSDETKGLTVFEVSKKRPGDMRKRQKNSDPSDIEGYLGPWGKYVDEKTVMRPSEVRKGSKFLINPTSGKEIS
jgi:pre-mRNA-processing factor 17